jgi:transmembrane sensor
MSNFTTQDLLQHPGFRKWVLEQDETAAAFWETWLDSHPEQEGELLEAKEILLALHGQAHTPSPGAESETWDRIVRSMESAADGAKVAQMPAAGKRRSRRWIGYAAAVAVLVAAASFWLFGSEEDIYYQTGQLEIRTIVLPDGSEVRLNGNSSLLVTSSWEKGKDRTVVLGGEAFFTIKQQPGAEPFIVLTNDMAVRVLGTSFNVNTRRGQTQVVLSNGKVQLELKNKASAPITMQPGDMIAYSSLKDSLVNKQVNPENYCSWRTKVLHFTDAPIRDVVRALQENTSVIIEPEDAGLGDQTFTGSIPLDDIGIFFKTISRTFNVQIEETGTNVYRISKQN